MAAPVTPTTPTTTSLSQNDALTELFAALARSGYAPGTEQDASTRARRGQNQMLPSFRGQPDGPPPPQRNIQPLMPSFRGYPQGVDPRQGGSNQLLPSFRGQQHSFA